MLTLVYWRWVPDPLTIIFFWRGLWARDPEPILKNFFLMRRKNRGTIFFGDTTCNMELTATQSVYLWLTPLCVIYTRTLRCNVNTRGRSPFCFLRCKNFLYGAPTPRTSEHVASLRDTRCNLFPGFALILILVSLTLVPGRVLPFWQSHLL
jgi:hypothetical protein